jgi:hypothetical protein
MSVRDWMFGIKQGIEIAKNNLIDYHLVIVNLKPGETSETAWHRHVEQNPDDINANIRVFNRLPI